MKKILFSILTLVLGISNYNAQCNITLSAEKQKFCSDEKTTLNAVPSDLKSIPDFSDSKKVFDVKDLKLDQTIINLINSGYASGINYPFDETKGEFNMNLQGVELKNTVISSGSLTITLQTDLKQDLKVVFELPYFKINGKSLKDSILVTANTNSTGLVSFPKEFDLTNAIVDFSAGNPSQFNIVSYKVKPTIKITTKIFTGTEVGNLKIDLKNLTFTENISYKWFLNNNELADKNTPNIEVNKSGTYKVITTSNCGSAEKEIEITVVERPSKDVTILGDLTFCDGDSVKLKAVGLGSYKWTNNDITDVTTIKKSGIYNVTVSYDICSSISDNITVKVNENPLVRLNHKDTTIIIGSEFILKASGAKEFEWNDKTNKDFISIKDGGIYSVIGKNEFGCTSTASIKVDVREKGAGLANLNNIKVITYPNPTSDVLNITIEEFKNKSISIIDLKGNLLFNQSLNSINTTIEIDSFAKGTYILNVVDGSNSVLNSQRIVIE